MHRRTLLAVAFAVLAVSAGATAAAATGTVTTIDADHGLTDRSSIDAYEKTGVASASLVAPDMRLTVAESHDDVGLSGFRFDSTKRYLRFQYNESFERTVRVYIPSEYWHPVIALKTESESGDATADFRPTASGRYTAVTVTFNGQTDAVFSISTAASGWFWAKDSGRDIIANSTGYEPPRIGSAGEWSYIPTGQLADDSSYPVNASSTIQYDTTPNAEQRTWLSVPECSGESVPVCTFEKRGVEDQVFVLAKTDNPPQVRWKQGTDPRAGASSAINDLAAIPERIQAMLDGLFGGSS